MNHLIKVSSEFRAFLQQSSSTGATTNARQEELSNMGGWAPAPPVSMPPVVSPAEIEDNRIVGHTGMRQGNSNSAVGDICPSQEGPDLSPPLDPHCSAGAATTLLPHPVVRSDAAVPTGSKDESQTFWRLRGHRAGEWRRSMFSQGVAIVRRLFKFSSTLKPRSTSC